MADDDDDLDYAGASPAYRRALGWVVALNLGYVAAEIVGGLMAGSQALKADALDFLGDATNYGISLGVAGMALTWRARAALVKGATILLFGLGVLAATLWAVWHGSLPQAEVMGGVGLIALVANGAVAWMLYRFRAGDANMRSVWICSRNDAIGNLTVMLAAVGVFGTHTAWPDLIVAAIIAGLGITGGALIIRQSLAELKLDQGPGKTAQAAVR